MLADIGQSDLIGIAAVVIIICGLIWIIKR